MLIEQIKREEGFRPTVYIDTEGYPTIGYGRLLKKEKMTLKEAKEKYGDLRVTEEEAEKDMRKYLNEVALPDAIEFVGEESFSELNETQQEALVSMAYNLGNITLNKFSGLRKAIQSNDLNRAAFEILDSSAASQALDRYAKIASTFGELPSKEKLESTKSGRKLLKKIESQVQENKYVPDEYNYLLEKEIPKQKEQVEEQGFFNRVGDFFSDTFGIGAEASEVPLMEELEQPREEVPMMSPTDAMRAQSQGRVVLDSHDSIPPLTNPEAGPSDTIKAVLTPGEAVIPAAAAQNPENEEKIQELLVEGRVKNDIAEANGVPVTDPAIAQIPKERLYDDVELDEYHRRNLTGKYGGGEQSLPGFAGGTMEVPSMMMMAPPKDPTMDEMKRIALKQMGYEQKSKNRTRDTVEKIGLKHLEETATADMKQMALDETMRNYGAEVPAPMQPVPQAPQGFEDGTYGASTYGAPYEGSIRDLDMALGGSGEVGINPRTNKPYPQYAPQEPSMEVPGRPSPNDTLLYAQPPAPDPLDELRINPRMTDAAIIEQAKTTSFDSPAYPAAQKVLAEQAQAQDVAAKQAKQEVKKEAPKSPVVNKKDKDDDDEDKGFLESLGTFGQVLGKVFDPESIMTAGVYYGVNRLLGYNNEVASQQALIGYTSGQKERAARVDYARRLGLSEAKDAQQAAAKRDESANKNIRTLTKDIASQLTSELSAEDLEELGVSRDEQANVLASLIQRRGIDLSTPEGLNAASALASGVSASYARKLKSGGDPSMADTFDRHLLSKFELTEALTDSEGRPLSTSATRGAFDKIRRNVNADSSIKDDQAQFVFEDRVNQAYQIFKDPANAEKIQALHDQGLLTPGAGENEFSLFLNYILKEKGSRVRTF